jgi:hypothetical protein
MIDEGYSQRALDVVGNSHPAGVAASVLDIIDVLPVGGVTRTPTSDLDLDRSRAASTTRGGPRCGISLDERIQRLRLAGVRVRRRNARCAATRSLHRPPRSAARRWSSSAVGSAAAWGPDRANLSARDPRFIETMPHRTTSC